MSTTKRTDSPQERRETPRTDTRERGHGLRNIIVGGVAVAAVVYGAGHLMNSVEGSSANQSRDALVSSGTLFHGDIKVGAGANVRSTPTTENGQGDGVTNITLTVPEGRTLTMHDPLETTDYNGNTWAASSLPDQPRPVSIEDLSRTTGWVNVTQLAKQGLIELDPANPKAPIIEGVTIADNGAIENANHAVIKNAATSSLS